MAVEGKAVAVKANTEYAEHDGEAFIHDAFKGRDGDREVLAQRLTRYLETTKSNYVLNINSPWGAGKTYFLREWQKQLHAEAKPKLCIYFNAWKYDHCDNAFEPIFATIAKELLEKQEKEVVFKVLQMQ